MTGIAIRRDIGGLVNQQAAIDAQTVTAGGDSDNVFLEGTAIDKSAHRNPLSVSLAVPVGVELGAEETATVTARLQHRASAEDAWEDFVTEDPVTLTESGTVVLDAEIAGAKRYIRGQVRVDFSASSADTAAVAGVATLEAGQETV